jgi:hypothetical protein
MFGVSIRTFPRDNNTPSYSVVSPNTGTIIGSSGHYDGSAMLGNRGLFAVNYTTGQRQNVTTMIAGTINPWNTATISIAVNPGDEIGLYISANYTRVPYAGTARTAFMVEGCIILI